MFSTESLQTYGTWLGYFTIFCALLTVVAWLFQWGVRFRLVGVTGFMVVLTGGVFSLSLALYSRPQIPGAVRFTRVYDMGSSQVVVTVPPEITESELDATLRQAAINLFSPGRMTSTNNSMTIRVRTIVHPEPGISKLLYLGQVQRSLASRQDDEVTVEIFKDQVAQLPKSAAS